MRISIVGAIVVSGLVAALGAQQKSQRLLPVRGPYPGFIELSNGTATPIVAITVDNIPASGQRDENVDVLFVTQLNPGVPKPPEIRGAGTLSYLEDRRSIELHVDGKRLYFLVGSTVPPASSGPPSYQASVVDVIISTKRADGVPPRNHAAAVEPFLKMAQLPFRR